LFTILWKYPICGRSLLYTTLDKITRVINLKFVVFLFLSIIECYVIHSRSSILHKINHVHLYQLVSFNCIVENSWYSEIHCLTLYINTNNTKIFVNFALVTLFFLRCSAIFTHNNCRKYTWIIIIMYKSDRVTFYLYVPMEEFSVTKYYI